MPDQRARGGDRGYRDQRPAQQPCATTRPRRAGRRGRRRGRGRSRCSRSRSRRRPSSSPGPRRGRGWPRAASAAASASDRRPAAAGSSPRRARALAITPAAITRYSGTSRFAVSPPISSGTRSGRTAKAAIANALRVAAKDGREQRQSARPTSASAAATCAGAVAEVDHSRLVPDVAGDQDRRDHQRHGHRDVARVRWSRPPAPRRPRRRRPASRSARAPRRSRLRDAGLDRDPPRPDHLAVLARQRDQQPVAAGGRGGAIVRAAVPDVGDRLALGQRRRRCRACARGPRGCRRSRPARARRTRGRRR